MKAVALWYMMFSAFTIIDAIKAVLKMFQAMFLQFGIPGSQEHLQQWFLAKGVFLLVCLRRFSQETLENKPFIQPPVREGSGDRDASVLSSLQEVKFPGSASQAAGGRALSRACLSRACSRLPLWQWLGSEGSEGSIPIEVIRNAVILLC